jgi:hypothetical protein
MDVRLSRYFNRKDFLPRPFINTAILMLLLHSIGDRYKIHTFYIVCIPKVVSVDFVM